MAPPAPNAHSARLLGANTSKMPRGRSADAGSKTSVATYSTTHASVTAFVKFHERKTCRSGPANPHMPGLRRPQTRQTGAEACVSLPHEGHKIDPVVLRNIAILVRWHSVALVEPRTEVDETAGERAERAAGVSLPRRSSAARGAGHGLLALPEESIVGDGHGEDGRVVHLHRILRAPAKRVNAGTWRTRGGRFSLTLIRGVA